MDKEQDHQSMDDSVTQADTSAPHEDKKEDLQEEEEEEEEEDEEEEGRVEGEKEMEMEMEKPQKERDAKDEKEGEEEKNQNQHDDKDKEKQDEDDGEVKKDTEKEDKEEGSSDSGGTTSASGSGGLHGKVCIVTGANTGIGKETALAIAALGAHVVLACRSVEKADAAIAEIQTVLKAMDKNRAKGRSRIMFGVDRIDKAEDASMESMSLNLSDLASVRSFAQAFKAKHKRLDILILNAGVVTTEKKTSAQGHELMFATNHLGHFFLTKLLMDTLVASSPARVVVVSSDAHKFTGPLNEDLKLVSNPPEFSLTNAMTYYGVSKLCNLLFTVHLAKLLKEQNSDITVNAVHPGAVNTELGRDTPWYLMWVVKPISRLFFRTPQQGARTSVYCAVSSGVATVSGKYFSNEREAQPRPYALDEDAAAALWAYSEELTKAF